MEKMRQINNEFQIRKVLNEYLVESIPLLLWQNFQNEKIQSICQLTISEDIHDCYAARPEETRPILPTPLFFHGQKHFLLFKISHFKYSKNQFAFKSPASIFCLEKRSMIRHDCTEKSNASLTFIKKGSLSSGSHTLKLMDISNKGCAVFMTSHSLCNFQVGDVITISYIGNEPVFREIEGTVRYIEKLTSSTLFDTNRFKMGIEYKEPLSMALYRLTRSL